MGTKFIGHGDYTVATMAGTDKLVIIQGAALKNITLDDLVSKAVPSPLTFQGSDTAANIEGLTGMSPGDLWVVSGTGGTIDGVAYTVGDMAIYDGDTWHKVENDADGKLNVADIDDTPADDADVPVSSKWVFDNVVNGLANKNLVYNSDFIHFSNQNATISTFDDYNHPDGYIWTADGSSPKIGWDSGEEACKIELDSDTTSAQISQHVEEVPRLLKKLQNKNVTFRVKIKTTSSTAKVRVEDGVDNTEVSVTGSGSEETIDVAHAVNGSATKVELIVKDTTASAVLYVYEISGNLGSFAREELPCVVEGFISGELISPHEAPPANYLEEDGTELAATFTRLNSVLNGKYGTGGSGRSNLPDARGRFIRAWDHGAGNDPDSGSRIDRGDGTTGDYVGTSQADEFKSHTHEIPVRGLTSPGGDIQIGSGTWNLASEKTTSAPNPGGGTETRPKNTNRLLCMKYA
jgi:hypothetical protein